MEQSSQTILPGTLVDPSDKPAARRWVRNVLPAVALVVMTCVVYLPSTGNGFIWDDDDYVYENPALQSTEGLYHIWFKIGSTLQYWPMVYTTLWIEYRLWGLDPMGYHVVNILLHALGAVLLWRVLRFVHVPGAWLIAAVFAVHPVHVESVGWITERKNVLSGVCYLSAMLLYLRYTFGDRHGPANTRPLLYAISLLLFICGMFSKTVVCSMPATVLLILWWKHGRITWPDVRRLIPFFIVGLTLGLVTAWVEKNVVGALGEHWNLSFIERCLVAGRALWFYAYKLVWPRHLVFVYERWQIDAHAWWQYLFPITAVSLVMVFYLLRHRLGRGPVVALLFFGGTLFPALGFFDVYPMQFSFVADHFQYLASIGIITLVIASLWHGTTLVGPVGRSLAICLAPCMLAGLACITWHHQASYKNLETLWRDTIDKNDTAWLAHNNLGGELQKQGRFDEAAHHFRKALQFNPTYSLAHTNLGNIHFRNGQMDLAIEHYRLSLKHAPDSPVANKNLAIALEHQGEFDEAAVYLRRAIGIQSHDATLYYHLGNVYSKQGRTELAIQQYQSALQRDPNHAPSHNNLASDLVSLGQLAPAINHFRAAIAADPSYVQARFNLSIVLMQTNQARDAVEQLQQLIQLQPDWPVPLLLLSRVFATHHDPSVRNPQQAVALAERAVQLTQQSDAGAWQTLAECYAASGRLSDAAQAMERAIAVVSISGGDVSLLRAQLQKYRAAQ